MRFFLVLFKWPHHILPHREQLSFACLFSCEAGFETGKTLSHDNSRDFALEFWRSMETVERILSCHNNDSERTTSALEKQQSSCIKNVLGIKDSSCCFWYVGVNVNSKKLGQILLQLTSCTSKHYTHNGNWYCCVGWKDYENNMGFERDYTLLECLF